MSIGRLGQKVQWTSTEDGQELLRGFSRQVTHQISAMLPAIHAFWLWSLSDWWDSEYVHLLSCESLGCYAADWLGGRAEASLPCVVAAKVLRSCYCSYVDLGYCGTCWCRQQPTPWSRSVDAKQLGCGLSTSPTADVFNFVVWRSFGRGKFGDCFSSASEI